MIYRELGHSALRVSAIGLGGMPLSIANRPAEKQAIKVLCTAFDAGIRLVDTANVYCLDDGDIGHNERLIAKAISEWGSRDDIVVATKGGLERPGGEWTRNARPAALRSACEASLQALGVEQIDLYQLHAPDPRVPFAESVGALKNLQDEGKIRHIGLSNVSVDQIRLARQIVPIVSVQNRCSPFDTSALRDGVLRYCARCHIAFIPYSPVGGRRGKTELGSNLHLVRIGRQVGASPFEVVLAWLLQLSDVVIPIPSASVPTNARSSARAAGLKLTTDHIAALDKLFSNKPTLKI